MYNNAIPQLVQYSAFMFIRSCMLGALGQIIKGARKNQKKLEAGLIEHKTMRKKYCFIPEDIGHNVSWAKRSSVSVQNYRVSSKNW
jgi:hypothetical protein